jgi:hypothetical protein
MSKQYASGHRFIVLLVGGPFDGQDIAVSQEEWILGALERARYRYEAVATSAGFQPSSMGTRIYAIADSATPDTSVSAKMWSALHA